MNRSIRYYSRSAGPAPASRRRLASHSRWRIQCLQVGGRIRAVAQPAEAAVLGGDDEQVVVDDAGVGDDPPLEVGLGDARSRERGGPQSLGCSIGGGAMYVGSCIVDTKSLWVGMITMGQNEATHAQSRYTTLFEELECQVGRELC